MQIKNIGIRDVAGLLITSILVVLFVQPSVIDYSFLREFVKEVKIVYVTGTVSFVLLVVFALRVHTLTENTRELIVKRDPEVAVAVDAPVGKCGIEAVYSDVESWFVRKGYNEEVKYLAMYGNKAVINEDVPDEVEKLFNQLQLTVANVYGVNNDCSTEKALEVVKNGEWCDNRRANAFLGSDEEGVAKFTIKERLRGWLNPEVVFEKRVGVVIEELEVLATGCMSYEKPNYKNNG